MQAQGVPEAAPGAVAWRHFEQTYGESSGVSDLIENDPKHNPHLQDLRKEAAKFSGKPGFGLSVSGSVLDFD